MANETGEIVLSMQDLPVGGEEQERLKFDELAAVEELARKRDEEFRGASWTGR